jgi:hypothetical protein
MKPRVRRIPCRGNCGRQIMKLHTPGVKSYNHAGYCRHCYKAKAHRDYKLENGKHAPGRMHRGKR